MRKIIIFIFLFMLSISVSNAQDYFGNRSKTSSRVGTEANLPVLALGELYWAQDADRLYIGRGDGTNRVLYLDTTTIGGLSKKPAEHQFVSSDSGIVDCSKSAVHFTHVSVNNNDTTTIIFNNIVAGVIYTIGIHGNYKFSFPGYDIKYPQGIVPLSSPGYTDIYNFIRLDSNNVYFRTYGEEY